MKQRWHGEINVAVALALAVMLGVALLPLPAHADPDPGWYDASWAYRKQITVDHSKVISALSYDAQTADFTEGDTITGGTSGATATIESDDDEGTSGTLYVYNVSGTFQDNETITDEHTGSASVDGTLSTPSNFPVLVHIDSSETDFWNHCSSESEVVFTQSDGTTKLKREVEEFDHTDDDLFAWVKTSLSSSTDTVLYMYYGNASASETDDADTWDFNHKGVWHLNETFGTHYDATTNSNDGAPNGGLNQDATGKIGGADDFDGADDFIGCGAGASLDITEKITYEAWIKAGTLQDWATIAGRVKSSSWADGGCSLYWYASAVSFWVNHYDTNRAYIAFSDTTNWHYVVGTYDKTTISVYLDGTKGTDDTCSETIVYDSSAFRIGATAQDAYLYPWDGQIDEVRVSDIVRSADWIKTCYNNQSNPSSFYSVGSEESTIGQTQTWYLTDIASGANYVMNKGSTAGGGTSISITKDMNEIWQANEAASVTVGFQAGNWTGDLHHTGTAWVSPVVVDIGVWDGSGFTSYGYASGTLHDLEPTWSFTISASPFNVPAGQYLAFKVSNNTKLNRTLEVATDGTSFVNSPSSDPGYPVPELPTIILLGAGLACLGGYVYFMRRKRRSVSP